MMFTGNIRYKKTLFGTIIVEIEYKYLHSDSYFNYNDAEERTGWKSATGEDLAAIGSKVPLV